MDQQDTKDSRSVDEISVEDALTAITILQDLDNRQLLDRAIAILEKRLSLLKRMRGQNSPAITRTSETAATEDKIVAEKVAPINGLHQLPVKQESPKRQRRSTGKQQGGDRRPKEQIEADRRAYMAIVNHIATQGPDTIQKLAELYGIKYQTLYQSIRIHSTYSKWFTLEGGKLYITNEGRQQALPPKE